MRVKSSTKRSCGSGASPSRSRPSCSGSFSGVGGAIFQSLTRNPLGSPDIIGFDAGSYTAVVITMLVVGTSNYWDDRLGIDHRRLGVTAFLVYVLA